MRIVIAGGTGFLGAALTHALRAGGHDVVVLTRQRAASGSGLARWTPDGAVGPWAQVVEGADAVVNLAGAPLDRGRWTAARKRALIDSRVLPTRSLARAIASASSPPAVFVSASAVGYYGARGDEVVTETTARGSGFLAELVETWEHEARQAESSPARVVLLRSGVVLAPEGGALARMLLPFRLGLGGPFGSGRQYLAWIHRGDWLDLVRWVLVTRDAHGPLNATAPVPVPNGEFAATLARVLRRPHVFRVPAFALRLALGEMADAALLTGQRVLPARAQALGFRFRRPALELALRDLLGR
jgi:uncharacterized protein (TIGR01777 family)